MARQMNISGADVGYIADVALEEGVGVIVGAAVNSVQLPTADGQQLKGVTLYDADAADRVTLRKLGIAEVQTTGAFSAGDELIASATTGAFKKYVPDYGGGLVFIHAIAEETNAADETTGFVQLVHYTRNDTLYMAASADPGTDHDGVDTATLGATFQVGALWINLADGGLFRCSDNSTGAAVWGEVTIA